jgi:PKD repeat protein
MRPCIHSLISGALTASVVLSAACAGGGEDAPLRPADPPISADWAPGSNCAEGHDLAAGWTLFIDGCPSGPYADQSGTFQYEFAAVYQPNDPQTVVATYEYRYLSETQYGVRLVDAVFPETTLRPGWFSPFAVSNAFTLPYFQELAGTKFIGFVGSCSGPAASDPVTCWEDRDVNDLHLEPRVCVDNSANGVFGDPLSWCVPNPADEDVHLKNQLPTAGFTAAQQSVTQTSATWLFNSSPYSSDPEASALTYTWKITSPGGGVETVTTSSPTLTRVFTVSGTYTARLAAVDGGGGLDAISQQFVVTFAPSNQPPTARFTYSCTYLSCSFTDTSTDPDGSIVSRSWTFGDGGTSTAQNPSHPYAAGGTYPVRLTVTDNGGLQDDSVRSVTVAPPPTLSASINGPTLIGSLDVCMWNAEVSGGSGSFSYEWKKNFTVVGTDVSWMGGGTSTFILKLKVTDNASGQIANASTKVRVYQSQYVNPC